MVSAAVQGVPEPFLIPQPSRKTPELCLKLPRAWSYPQSEIPAAEEAPARDPHSPHSPLTSTAKPPNQAGWDLTKLGFAGSFRKLFQRTPGWLWP